MNSRELIFRPPSTAIRLGACLAGVGGVALVAGLVQAPERVWPNVLLVSYYLLSLGLGGLVFVALQYVSAAGWSVSFRRVPEGMFAVIPLAAACMMIVFLLSPSLYPWTSSSAAEAHNNTPLGRAWLSRQFFLARSAIYLVAWLLLGLALLRNSRRQDIDRALAHSQANIRISALFLVVFGVTFWLASTDWLMSLEPQWSSTMFALYQFGGLLLGGLAAIILLASWLEWMGPFRNVFIPEHRHDLGKLLFGFSSFWMYLWFCQYMLIWYVNNPEETVWFTRRLHANWGPLLVLNIVLNWAVPFLVLLPRATKQNAGVLVSVCVVVLAGRWLDLYIGILPMCGPPSPISAVWEVGLLAGAVGLGALLFLAALRKAAIIPLGDPFLQESLPAPALDMLHE
jgi:hypothetical protein